MPRHTKRIERTAVIEAVHDVVVALMLRSRFETVGMSITDEEIASFRDTLDTVGLPTTAATLDSAVKAHVLAGAASFDRNVSAARAQALDNSRDGQNYLA